MILKKNKNGFLKTMEAFLAILLAFIFVVFFLPKNFNYVENQSNFLLRNLETNELFRNCVVGRDDDCIRENIDLIFKGRYSYEYVIYNFAEPDISLDAGNVMLYTWFFSGNHTSYEPTTMKLYYWDSVLGDDGFFIGTSELIPHGGGSSETPPDPEPEPPEPEPDPDPEPELNFYIELNTIEDLNNMRNNLSENYSLMRNLDFLDCNSYSNCDNRDAFTTGEGWVPISWFQGFFDGQNYTISNLYINQPESYYVGFFEGIDLHGSIANLGLINVNVTGNSYVGGLVGGFWGGEPSSVINSFVTGFINGTGRNVGGLLGEAGSGLIVDSYTEVTVVGGAQDTGGLIGQVSTGMADCLNITNSHSIGDVTGSTSSVGGLVGHFNGRCMNILDSYSEANVVGAGYIGGLIGYTYDYALSPSFPNISNSYATGDVTAETNTAGGLVGYYKGTILNSHGTGTVNAGEYNGGGLVGHLLPGSTIANSYATGSVRRKIGSASTSFGGLVGFNQEGNITNSYSTGSVHYLGAADPTDKGFVGFASTGDNYYDERNFFDTETSGQSSTTGNAIGRTTSEMQSFSNFDNAGWDIVLIGNHDGQESTATWFINDGNYYPRLWFEYE